MDTLTLITCAIGLAMDAFAVSICKGLSLREINIKKQALVGTWFGGFQGLMPLIGFFLGINFKSYIENFDHWIAFILLGFIGINMIKESLEKEDECESCGDDSLNSKNMFVLAVATSIDALAVGITFAFLDVNIYLAVFLIGAITFVLSMVGVQIGHVFGSKYKSKAELTGGIILIFIGLKILLEHLHLF